MYTFPTVIPGGGENACNVTPYVPPGRDPDSIHRELRHNRLVGKIAGYCVMSVMSEPERRGFEWLVACYRVLYGRES